MPQRPRSDGELPIDPDLAPDDPAEPTIHPGRVRSARRRRSRARPDILLAIAVGGSLGTLARAGLGVAFPTAEGQFPWTTFAINVTGSFVLGLVLVVLVARLGPRRLPRPFIATGFLGGFTTYSTFMVEADQLGRSGHVSTAVVYVAASVLVGLFAAWLGIAAGRRVPQPPLTTGIGRGGGTR